MPIGLKNNEIQGYDGHESKLHGNGPETTASLPLLDGPDNHEIRHSAMRFHPGLLGCEASHFQHEFSSDTRPAAMRAMLLLFSLKAALAKGVERKRRLLGQYSCTVAARLP